ncbi:hypothetical protein [Achromobacter dolens]|uniref:hypothetical protein n=1 Tax=Achromobacter dolens TaxID=1287738 RepID=UPI0015827F36|nr:hypothetical protein [Achromobacter dolens]
MRQQSALNQNGVSAEWHLPTDAKAKKTAQKIQINFGNDPNYPNKIHVKTEEKGNDRERG